MANTTMYKKRIPYYKAKTVPVEHASFDMIPIDCSCEIWMMAFRMQFDTRLIELLDLYFRMSSSIVAAEKFIVKHFTKQLLKIKHNLMRISKQQPLFVFDGVKTNPYKQRLTEERQNARNDAYQNFVIALQFSRKNLGKLYLEYMSHKCAGLQQLIYERLKNQNAIRADDDSDFLLRRYPAVYSHDMDLLLMGCGTIITGTDDNDMYYKSTKNILNKWKMKNKEELVAICILLGTDYNRAADSSLTFQNYRKMNISSSSITDLYMREIYELFSQQTQALPAV
jgi:hypothetical protein